MKRELPGKAIAGLALLLFAHGALADPISQWTWRFPSPQGNTLRAVAYGGGQFVAVGDVGTIITSTDGYNWTNQTSGVSSVLRAVSYADGEYAAVGDGGFILVSSNAVNWTPTSTITGNTLRGIAGNAGWKSNGLPQFLAVGDSGLAVACNNGTNWSVTPSGTSNTLNAVACSPTGFPSFLMVGNGGTVVSYWSLGPYVVPAASVGTPNNLYAVALSGNGAAAAAGDLNLSPVNTAHHTNEILYSSSFGTDWSHQEWISDGFANPNLWQYSAYFILHGLACGPNGFVAAGDTGYTLEYFYPGVVFTSANGTSWTENSGSTSESRLYGATYGNGLYVLVGDAGGIVVSSNLVNWVEVTGNHKSAITAIACSDNLCIASGQRIIGGYSGFPDFTTIVSSNAVNWIPSSVNLPEMIDLTSGGTHFVGIHDTTVLSTTDGFNWQGNSTFTNSLYGVKYLNGKFFAVGNNGSIFTSIDATNWTDHSVSTSGSFYGVAFGNGLYVAAGSVSATSLDGISWSLCASNPPAAINRIVYGSGQFVAAGSVGGVGELLTSQDGVNWQVRFTGNRFPGLACNGGNFLAISEYGNMFKSSDGTNWLPSTTLPLVDGGAFRIYYRTGYLYPILADLSMFTTVCAYKGTFLAAGLDGVLIQSGNTWNPATLTAAQSTPDGFTFSFNQQIDVPYRIQTSANLLNWVDVHGGIGTGQSTNFNYPAASNGPAKFFRIVSP